MDIRKIVNGLGGARNIALELDISTQAVQSWCDKGRIPARAAIEIERMTDGEYKAVDLVGDLY